MLTRLVATIGLGCICALTATSADAVSPWNEEDLEGFYDCDTPAECVVVDRIGCCSCSMGGSQAAINATKAAELEFLLDARCGAAVICIALYHCASYMATCIDGTCTLLSCGDVDSSRDITVVDALIVLRSAVATGPIIPPGLPFASADVDCSATVTPIDALLLLRCAVGLRCDLCCTY